MPNLTNVSLIGKLGRDERGAFYDYVIRITLEETNIEGTVSHDRYARFFGKARELFILEHIPEAAAEMGRTHYLQTRSASYDFKKNCRFGEMMIVRLRVLRVGNSSFEIGAEFINAQTNDIYATGSHVIICTDLKGAPIKIPDRLRSILMDALLPLQPPEKN